MIIFQNSKCIIRTIESYGDKQFPISEQIKHITCGIVPHVLDKEGIGGFLFLTMYGGGVFGESLFFDTPSPDNRSVDIYGILYSREEHISEYVFGLTHNLVQYGLCFGPTQVTSDQCYERTLEIVKDFVLYE